MYLLKQVEDRLSKETSPFHESAPVPNYWCARGEYAPWVWGCAWSANVSSGCGPQLCSLISHGEHYAAGA